MIYTYKHYMEVEAKEVPNIPIDKISHLLNGKSKLGNFLSQVGNLFRGKEIYDLKREIDFLKKFEITDNNFKAFINIVDEVYNYINYSLEFLDINKNQDLFLFSLVNNNHKYNFKIYELKYLSPLLLTDDDLQKVFNEFDKWNYNGISSLLFYSQGFINQDELLKLKYELKKIKDQKLVSSQALNLVDFFLKSLKMKNRENFLVLEKYLSIYH